VGSTGSTVRYSLAAGADTSIISKVAANAKAAARLSAEGQAYANTNGVCYYSSDTTSALFTRNNCVGSTGTTVRYSLAAGADTSITSKAAANAKALTRLNAGGQTYANTNGVCYYSSDSTSAFFTRNNCVGSTGTTVRYSLAAGADTSITSKAAANAKALTRLNAGGQTYANTNGVCYYSSDTTSALFTRNDCVGSTGTTVRYSLAAGADTSITSKAAANAKALTRLNAGGQAYANTNGVCYFSSDTTSALFTRNNCVGSTGTTVRYSLAAGADTSITSKAAANAKAATRLTAGGQTYANTNGQCYFSSDTTSGLFTRNNCVGSTGTAVRYSLAAGVDTSIVSKAAANAKALTRLNAGGPTYANANGQCYFSSDTTSALFQRNNCTGGVGTYVRYSLAAGADTSIVSKAAANAKAASRLTAGGPTYANTNGTCKYYSDAMTGSFTRTGCTSPLVGSTVTYTLPANYDSSTVSKADANSIATGHFNTLGQAYAQTNGTCVANTIPITINPKSGATGITSAMLVTVKNSAGTILYNKSFSDDIGFPSSGTVSRVTSYTIEISAMDAGHYASVNGGTEMSLGSTQAVKTFLVTNVNSISVLVWKQ
jgi:hypothetical protein